MRWHFRTQEYRGCCGGRSDRRDERHFRGRGGFGPGAGPFGGRRGGGAGRFFESGALRFVILSLIAETPRHGYEIIKLIEERLGGAYTPSPGVVYPMLTMMEEMGQATVQVDGTRKMYAITGEGSRILTENRRLRTRSWRGCGRLVRVTRRSGGRRSCGRSRISGWSCG